MIVQIKFKINVNPVQIMVKNVKKTFHTGSVRKTIKIKASRDKVWRKISNIAGLSTWVIDVKKTVYLSKKKKGVGAVRLITFADGNKIEEHVVAWEDKESFTYIATEGLLKVFFPSRNCWLILGIIRFKNKPED